MNSINFSNRSNNIGKMIFWLDKSYRICRTNKCASLALNQAEEILNGQSAIDLMFNYHCKSLSSLFTP